LKKKREVFRLFIEVLLKESTENAKEFFQEILNKGTIMKESQAFGLGFFR
jgi:hypothetical protein